MIGALMNNQGIIHALEPDFIRMERLKFNCAQLGITCVEFFQTEAQKFEGVVDSYDAILADVPCSGEGRFNLHERYNTNTRKLTPEMFRAVFANVRQFLHGRPRS
jgi:16S rRNA C967 or C1407 C5-methylase (RsmB/RsmF family)